jgi:hypothetical protein
LLVRRLQVHHNPVKHITPILSALILGCATLAAQEPPPAPDSPAPATITGPIADGTPPPPVPPKPPLNLTVLRSHQQPMRVDQPAPLPVMPATTHTIKTTIEIVKRPPPAPAPAPPAVPSPPLDAAALARLAALRAERRSTELVFLSATVYDHQRTLLRWHPNGRPDQEMTAWSNLDWNDFCGLGSYTWNNRKFVLFMGIGNESTAARAGGARRTDRAGQASQAPALPTGGPAFVVTQGDPTDPAATDLITGLHELYQTEGPRLKAARLGREQANREREAAIRAHPPIPADIIIRCYPCERPAKRQPAASAPAQGGAQ